jgi:hypothetical protein
VALLIGALAGPFLLRHLPGNTSYYTALAWGLSQGPEAAAAFLSTFLRGYVLDASAGPRALQGAACLAALLVHAVDFAGDRGRSWTQPIVSAWLALAAPLLLVLVLQTSADPSAALYALPGAAIALATPVPIRGTRRRRGLAAVAALLAATSLWVGARAAGTAWRWATRPERDATFNRGWVTVVSADVREQKAFDVALADALARQGSGLVWSPFFDESSHVQTMEAYDRSGRLVLPAGPRYFTIYERYWRGFYPGASAREIGDRVYAAANGWVDLAVVLDDPARAESLRSRVNPFVANPITRFVARDVAERIRDDPRWRRVFVVESAHYGRVAGYRNLESRGRGYKPLLESHELFRSGIDP